ncbi:hypothetical protein [Ornithinicoccus hortensis]|uniref:Uncharacterized protein n=1 Tax=Ornithinicoccus hortensis TaxID=82346 RepID=A0A542YLT5_9MICO|nr:hypothetical protein [Ornithinicoccus hortensis]TQL49011.1 hypothetical protein FB467_0075 [Ornithinicoccus hortensis]
MDTRAIPEGRALDALRRALRSRRGKAHTWLAVVITVLALLQFGAMGYEGAASRSPASSELSSPSG